LIEYYNEDSMVGMARYPDKYFDLAIVDPPYGIGNFVQTTGNVRGEKVTWNDSIPPDIYFKELERVSKERIIWGANYYNCFNDKGGAIVWYKQVPPESNLSECEIASYSRLKRVGYVHLKWQNINRTETTIHPCQKPAALYKWLLKNYAKQGDLILDTHVGSASSLIACHDMGFDAVGFELDPDYYKASKQRLEDFMAQPSLDELVVEQREQIGLEGL
jgi:site-specific DNA-methyltransferase (adenine-specific)